MSTAAPLAARCHRCSARVLEVRADWYHGYLFGEPRLDPVALTPDQVVACVLVDVPLWQIHHRAGHTVTSQRTAYWPRRPDTVTGPIAPEHACGRVWTAPALDLARLTPTYPDTPPF